MGGFEPNDANLWRRLRLNISAIMMTLFRAGAYAGSTPDHAFYVKCDRETTTQADIDLGQVKCTGGLCTAKARRI